MAMDAPLKKRKLYEVAAASEPKISKPSSSVPSPQNAAAAREEEESLRKRRNREEIGALYKMYRRLKFCLEHKQRHSLTINKDLQDAYFSILNLSAGCTSVRRIAAEFIPRYAIHCPSALELAFIAIKQIFEDSMSAILQGRDLDGIAFKTAETCLSGMVELSSAAEAVVTEFPDLEPMCMTVGQNISSYLLHKLNGRDLAPANTDADAGGSQEDKSRTLIPSYLMRLYRCHPKQVFGACFDLLKDDKQNVRKIGRHFLEQVMKEPTQPSRVSTIDAHAPSLESEGGKTGAKSLPNLSDTKDIFLENDEHAGNQMDDGNSSLIVKVLHQNSPLEKWLVSEARKFYRSASVESVNESLPILTALLKSLKSFLAGDPNLFFIEDDETTATEDNNLQTDRETHMTKDDSPHVSEKCIDLQNVDHETEISPASNNSSMASDVLDPKEETDLEGFGNSSGFYQPSTVNATPKSDPGVIFTSDNEALNEEKEHGILKYGTNAMTIDCTTVKDSPNSQMPEKVAGVTPELRDSGKDTSEDEPACVAGYVCAGNREGPTGHTFSQVAVSPRLVSTQTQKRVSSQGQVAWYSDGDPAALDVFAASKQLWLGSLGPAANEVLVRHEFEKFGPIESFSLFPVQDFGLIEYRNINDAVKAREALQGATQWGAPLKIKFLDVGLGSRGAIGGVAVGGSCHVYIGGVYSQSAKNELVKDMIHAGLKSPLSVCALVSASALLLEFDAPEEAAAAMLHVRQRRIENKTYALSSKSLESSLYEGPYSGDGAHLNQHLWVGHIDPSVNEQDLISAFSQFGEITGWRFVRQNGFCLIDFHLPESAAFAKAQLNGKRFGSQSIQVEYKHVSPKIQVSSSMNSPPCTLHTLPGNASNSWLNVSPPVSFQPGTISKKNLPSPSTVGIVGSRARSSRSGREAERVPTNTLWFGLSDCHGKSFLADSELRAILNTAAQGIGFVTKVKSARTARGACKFVEFDSVEAAATALQNSARLLDSSIQIEFSNSAISLQQSDFPHNHSPFFQSSTDDNVREDKLFIGERDRERELRSPTFTGVDGSRVFGGHSHTTTGVAWGCTSVVFTEDGTHRVAKYQVERSAERLDDRSKVDTAMDRMSSLTSFRSLGTCALSTALESPGISQGSGQIWSNSQSLPECHPPAIGGVTSLVPQCVTHPPLASVSHPTGIHQDRLPSVGFWTGVSASCGIDQASPVPSSVQKNFFPNVCNVATPLQSPATSMIMGFSGGTQTYEQRTTLLPPSLPSSPPASLFTNPAPPPVSQSPSATLQLSSVLQPLTAPLPPPPPLSVDSQINLVTCNRDINRPSLELQQWRGPLCKSGFQYCEIVAYSQESAVCQYETIREPAQWPNKLDVTKRADFRSVKYSFNNTAATQRQVCRLFGCSGPNNKEGYQQFEAYLRQRDRAGVVMIPATGNLWARILFILPWSREACELMGISDKPTDCFIGLLLPLDTAFN